MLKLKIIPLVLIAFIAIAITICIMPISKQAKDSTEILFQDFEDGDDVFTVTDNVKASITDEDAYQSTQSLKYEVVNSDDPTSKSGSISIKSIEDPIDVTESKYLTFYIKDTQGSNTLKVSITDNNGQSSDFEWKSASTKKDKWTKYHIPMASFDSVDKSNINEIRIGQWNKGIYYIDNIYFTDTTPTLPPENPTAYKSSGEYSESVTVELKSSSGDQPIYYTTDGTLPDKDSDKYIEPLVITHDCTITAVTYNPESELYSDYSIFEYIILDKKEVIEPTFSPAGGTFFNSQSIVLTTPTKNATIYYTIDGSTPTEDSEKYIDPIHISKNTVVKAIAVKDGTQTDEVINEYIISNNSSAFLKTDGKDLRNNFGSGDQVMLRGTNVGGWLVMEDWMTPVNSPDQKTTIDTLTDRFGEEKAADLINVYQDHYWQASDFDYVKEEGMNVLRLPFTYFEMLNDDGSLKSTAFDRLDWFIEEAEKRELYVILDLHGAPGSQNGKDHSGDISHPDGGNLYGNEENMNKTEFLWTKIAERYKGNEWIAGYDILNEPEGAQDAEQFEFYDRLYKSIREVDKDHIIYFEAIWNPTDLPNPEIYQWENIVYSYHFYGWDDTDSFHAQKKFTDSKVPMVNEMTNYNVPLLVGEFTLFNNVQSWEYALDVYEEQQWHYTTWTYKVTGEGSSWGIFTGDPPKVDIYNDSEQEIREKWSEVGTNTSYIRNNYIADTLRNYSSPSSRVSDDRILITDFENIDTNLKFDTGTHAKAQLDNSNTSSGEASLKLTVTDDTNIDEQYVSIKATENQKINIDDKESTFPKYLVLDIFNGTSDLQTAYITFIDNKGKKISTWTHKHTPALDNAWSKIPLLLSTVEGDIDKNNIVEIRIAMEQMGVYNIDNIFIGQSFANELPEDMSNDVEVTKPDETDEGNEEKEENKETGEENRNDDQWNNEVQGNNDDQVNGNGNEFKNLKGKNNEENIKTSTNNSNGESNKILNDNSSHNNKLPTTSLNIYNFLLIGVVLIMGGGIYLSVRKLFKKS